MKTLKITRLLSLIATLVFMLIAFLPKAINETDDWIMIVVLAVAFVALPINLMYYTKREKSSRYLVDTENGMLLLNVIVFGILLIMNGVGLVVVLVNGGSSYWGYLSWISASLYIILNNIILYKAKKAYDIENNIKNS